MVTRTKGHLCVLLLRSVARFQATVSATICVDMRKCCAELFQIIAEFSLMGIARPLKMKSPVELVIRKACSSVWLEHHHHMVGVSGSNPFAPTNSFLNWQVSEYPDFSNTQKELNPVQLRSRQARSSVG